MRLYFGRHAGFSDFNLALMLQDVGVKGAVGLAGGISCQFDKIKKAFAVRNA